MHMAFLVPILAWASYDDVKNQLVSDWVHVLLGLYALFFLHSPSMFYGLAIGGGLMLFLNRMGLTGEADVLLISVLGMWYGLAITKVLLGAFLLGGIYAIGVYIKNRDRKQKVPFVPFISLSALLVYLF